MTRRSRRNHSAVFKAKVALAAVKGEANAGSASRTRPSCSICHARRCTHAGADLGGGFAAHARTIPNTFGSKVARMLATRMSEKSLVCDITGEHDADL